MRDGLVEKATEIGRLRWLSLRDRLQLVFRKSSNGEFKYIDYQAFCDKVSWELEPKRLVKEILQFSVRLDLQIDDLVQRMKQLPQVDPWQICVGHDLVGLLMVGLRRKIGTKNRTIEDLQRELRLAFQREDLEKTSMYRALRSWEQQHPPYRIFPS